MTTRRMWRSYLAETALGTRASRSFVLAVAFSNSLSVTMDLLPSLAVRLACEELGVEGSDGVDYGVEFVFA